MWEVKIRDKQSSKCKKIIAKHWDIAREIAKEAASKGYHASFKRYYTNVLIADCDTGEFLLVATRLTPIEASRFSLNYAKLDRRRGCVLWPHESPTPEGWRVVRG